MSNAKLKKSIARVGYAMATLNDETGELTYGDVTWLISNEAGGREYSAAPKGELTEIYADGVVVYSAEENHGYDISLTLLSVIDDIDEDWLGNAVTEEGVAEYANGAERPLFALLLAEDTTDGVGQTTVYYNCYASARPTDTGKTTENGAFEGQFAAFTIAARPRRNDKLVRYKLKKKELVTKVPEPTATTEQTTTEQTTTEQTS